MTIGYHIVKTAYGRWLPGDERGHCSSVWDEQIGQVTPRGFQQGHPALEQYARSRMAHPPVTISKPIHKAIEQSLRECEKVSAWSISALAIEPTHMHLLVFGLACNPDSLCKWLAQQTTKHVHAVTSHVGPVWAKGKWCAHIQSEEHWLVAMEYINRHPHALTTADSRATPNKTAVDNRASTDKTADVIRAAPSKTAVGNRAAPSKTADVNRAAPSKTAVGNRAAPSKTADVIRAAPSKTADVNRAAPSKTADVNRAAPSKTADVNRAAPSKTAVGNRATDPSESAVNNRGFKIISGGQAGADRAALDFAIAHRIEHGGWVPRGRMAEDGPIDARYQLRETPSCNYAERTEWNLRDADATIIFSHHQQTTGGTRLTIDLARRYGKPWLHLVESAAKPIAAHAAALRGLIDIHQVATLNIAGPRASQAAGIEAFVAAVLSATFASSCGCYPRAEPTNSI